MSIDCGSRLAPGDLVHLFTIEGGILLQAFGVVAAASGAVPGLFRRTWTSLGFGLVGALTGGAGMAVPVLLLLALYLLVAVFLPVVLPLQLVARAAVTGAYLVVTGCLFGLAIGVIAGVVRASSRRLASAKVMTGIGAALFLAAPAALLVAAGRCQRPVFVAPYVIGLCLYGLALGAFAGSTPFSEAIHRDQRAPGRGLPRPRFRCSPRAGGGRLRIRAGSAPSSIDRPQRRRARLRGIQFTPHAG